METPVLNIIFYLLLITTNMSRAKHCSVMPPCKCHPLEPDIIICTSLRDRHFYQLPIAVSKHEKITRLNITDSYIINLPPKSFGNLRLQGLSIEKSVLLDISPDAFAGLENLQYFALLQDLLFEIPAKPMRHLLRASIVILSNNNIKEIRKDDFIHQKNLQTLSLSENQIERIVPGSLPATLTHLMLCKNKLKSLVGLVNTSFPVLRVLALQWNELSVLIQSNFQLMPKLKDLSLNENQLMDVTGAFNGLFKLERLNLSGNELRSLERVFGRFPNLRSLALAANLLTAVGFIGTMPFLVELDLSRNFIEEISADAFAGAPNVGELNLSGNLLKSFPSSALLGLQYLTVLDLSGNRMTSLAGIEQMEFGMLKELYISRNKITTPTVYLFNWFPSLIQINDKFRSSHTKKLKTVIKATLSRL